MINLLDDLYHVTRGFGYPATSHFIFNCSPIFNVWFDGSFIHFGGPKNNSISYFRFILFYTGIKYLLNYVLLHLKNTIYKWHIYLKVYFTKIKIIKLWKQNKPKCWKCKINPVVMFAFTMRRWNTIKNIYRDIQV